jgi:hypothetical protein
MITIPPSIQGRGMQANVHSIKGVTLLVNPLAYLFPSSKGSQLYFLIQYRELVIITMLPEI